MSSQDIKDFTQAVLKQVEKKMFGLDEITRITLVALYTGGHVLLEGNPGLGKTELVKTLGEVLSLPRGRIQFTPDLMPADITGTFAPDFESGNLQSMSFQPGPVFTSLLLADEINRATPKTQSAMLEAMAEKQVTVLGKKYPLELPFMVLATQNPIDHEGTFNLPEAQADRFMFKVSMPTPNTDTLKKIIQKTAGNFSEIEKANHSLFKDDQSSRDIYHKILQRILNFPVSPLVETHVLNIVHATNYQFNMVQGVEKKQLVKLEKLVKGTLEYGLGPRAATTLTLGAKAFSLMFLPGAESAESPALARIAIPTLRHRFKLTFDWQQTFRQLEPQEAQKDDDLLVELIRSFCIATAPADNEYTVNFSGSFLRGGKV